VSFEKTMSDNPTPDYRLWNDDDTGLWVAEYVKSGIASYADTPTEAVQMADDAARLHDMDHTLGDAAYQQEMLDRYDIHFEF